MENQNENQMDNQNEEEFLLSGEKGKFYGELLDKYEEFIFHSEGDEQEFITCIKNTLDDEMDFETKIYIIRSITMDVILRKIIDAEMYIKYNQKKPE